LKGRHWLGIAISVACLWWALRGVSWSEVWIALRHAHLAYLVAAAAGAVVVGVLIRALRWRVFLPPEPRAPTRELITATGIGLMANNVLPARMGEFVRAYVLGRRTGVPATTAFGSLFVERLFDAAALVAILVAAVLFSPVPPWMVVLARVGGAVFLILFGFEVVLVRHPSQVFRVLHATTARFLPGRWEAELEGALHKFIEGFQLLRDPRRVVLALGLTLTLWGANGVLYYLGLLAFDLGRVGLDGAMIVQSVASLGVSVPSSPGFVGTFQAFVVKALSAFDVDKDLAFSYSIGYHVAQYLPVTLYGFYLAWRANLSWREIEKSEERVEERLTESAEVA
jgi:uncharacterized protein (TIRG00374 family)